MFRYGENSFCVRKVYIISTDKFQSMLIRKFPFYFRHFSTFYYIALELELYLEQRSSELAFWNTPGQMNLLKITFLFI